MTGAGWGPGWVVTRFVCSLDGAWLTSLLPRRLAVRLDSNGRRSDQQGPKWRRVRPAKGAEWEDGQGLVGGASREAFSSAPKGFPCSRVRFDRRDRVPKLPKGLACSLARRGLLAGARLRLKPDRVEGRPSIERLHFGRKREEKGVFIPHRDAMAAVLLETTASGARGAHIVTS